MRDTNLMPLQTARYAAILEFLSDTDADGARLCRVHHRWGQLDAWTWLPPIHEDHTPRLGDVTTLELQCKDIEFVVLGFDATPPLSLVHALDDERCPIEGVVAQVSDVIDQLRSHDLRRFALSALLHRDALAQFWISPASRRDHHAYPGGLAHHSLEVATMVGSSTGLPDDDRDIGIVFALLHDYGKLWCYAPHMRGHDSKNHEQIGYTALGEPLDQLMEADPNAGAKLRELLGGPRAPRDSPYPLAIGKIVRAFDQMSCEKTRQRAVVLAPTWPWPAAMDDDLTIYPPWSTP